MRYSAACPCAAMHSRRETVSCLVCLPGYTMSIRPPAQDQLPLQRTRIVSYSVNVVVLILTRIIKSVVTEQAPVTVELRNTPRKKHKQTAGGTRMYHS